MVSIKYFSGDAALSCRKEIPAEPRTSTYLTPSAAAPIRNLRREPTRSAPAVFKKPLLEITGNFLSRRCKTRLHAYAPLTREPSACLERYLDRLSVEDNSACDLAELNFDIPR